MSGLRAPSAIIAVMLAATAPLLAACDQPDSAVASTASQPAEPDVSIVAVKPQPRALLRELPGRIAPIRVSEVRPRVSGIVIERLFRQGSEVKAGDPLYRIDPRPFEVEVQANEAALAKAQAVYERAVQQARRMSFLARERAAPEIENEKAIAAEKEAAADAEARKADLAEQNVHASNGGDPRMFKVSDDPRVTRVGRFLRRWSLDELPQLINVLRGEMSLVGPRPLILDEDRYVHDWARKRLELKPGVTGLW